LFRIRTLAAAALTTLLVCAAATPVQAGTRTKMIRAINFVRGSHHLRLVHYSHRLSDGARSWARHLMHRDYLAHSARAIHRHEGEIIEWHTGRSAHVRNTVVEWWNSAEHRTVMMSHGYRRAGAGRAVGRMGSRRCTIWVVRFAR
jgi:uncharacterized protein YkwD